jgi:hypothetical protein
MGGAGVASFLREICFANCVMVSTLRRDESSDN